MDRSHLDHVSHGQGRLPDFVVIGTMKSGTTTLFRGLGAHPRVQLPSMKEPNFYCDDDRWRKGVRWYTNLFTRVDADALTGEASVAYTDPRWSARTASRLASVAPTTRLVCVLRHPLDRMRSHYRHEVQRGREKRLFVDAVATLGNPYVLRSNYASALEPWVETFSSHRLLVVRFEDLFEGEEEWKTLLAYLQLDYIPLPAAHNVTADKAAYSTTMRVLWETGLIHRVRPLPASARRVGKRLLLRAPERRAALFDSASAAVPARVVSDLELEMGRLADMLPGLRTGWELRH